ncbi:MAG: hypothetical protein IIY77_08180, partial [Lachnospiraceae bacterium]|nr:hypothetical protein [Lachnospiraceae bacterium]
MKQYGEVCKEFTASLFLRLRYCTGGVCLILPGSPILIVNVRNNQTKKVPQISWPPDPGENSLFLSIQRLRNTRGGRICRAVGKEGGIGMGRNTLEKNWFIAEHFICGVVIFIWYRSVFCCLENCTLAASRLILVGILAAASIVFGFAELRSRRNTLNVILNLFFGYGLYSVLAYKHIFTEFIRMTLIPSGAAALLLTGFILLRPIAKKKEKGSVIRLRVRRSIRAVQKSFGMGLSVILLVLVVNNLFGDCLFPSNAETFFRQSTEEETIAGKIEKIALLESSSWAKLT